MNQVKASTTRMQRKVAAPPPPPVDETEVHDDASEQPEEAPEETGEASEQQGGGNERKLQAYLDKQAELLKVNELDLQSEFVVQAQRYFKAAINFHKAEAALQQQKNSLGVTEAQVDYELRSSGEKTTQGYIDTAIKGDPRIQAHRDKIVIANLQVGLHQACVRAWEHKKDMLMQSGMMARADLQNGLQVNKTHPDQERPAVLNGRPTRL